LWSFLLRRKTRQLLNHSKGVISICPEMSEVYQEEFGCPATTVMTGTNFTLAKEPRVNSDAKTLRYFGKVSLNRYRSLADIAEAIDLINSQQGSDYTLEIYCGAASPTEEKALKQYKCIKMYDFISGKQFEETFFSSDALVHIEAFDEKSIERVRHSVSTKIADSMACGIPLLAYGPKEIASIGHLLRNECAFTATDKQQLDKVLRELFSDYQLRYEISQKALETASQYHDPEKASNSIKEIVSGKVF
jgi:glycosyltransferase involved in cell wall biosynthesis